jgi:molecular chaperone GrpE
VERPRPQEDAVRDQLREEDERAERTNGAQAAGDEPAAEATVEAEEGSTDENAGDAGPAFEATAEAPEQESEDELAVAKRERDEYLDRARRTQADFENFRKRASKDMAVSAARARNGLIREMLPVLDNLERALANAPADDPMAEGVKLVLMDLQGVLQRAGVETIEPKGEAFDPNVHEALTTRQVEGVDAGVVLDVVEKGYKGADQVIRPARVIVAA